MADQQFWLILYPCDGREVKLLTRQHVHVRYSPDYARRENPILEERIERFRQAYLQKPGAYESTNYRLAGLGYEAGDPILHIGPSKYLEYIAYRNNPALLQGLANTLAEGKEYLPNVVGNVGILLTQDQKSFCVARSEKVSTYRGYLDFPGGHPEPSLVEEKKRQAVEAQFQDEELIRDELFEGVIRETIEDLGIEELTLNDPLLFAVLLNNEDVMKPDMAFLITTPHTSDEVRQCYLKHEPRPPEVAELIAFPLMGELSGLNGYRMTPIMEGALVILHQIDPADLEQRIQAARDGD